MRLDVEQLIVDNDNNTTQGVNWTVSNGATVAARSGSDSADIVSAEGAGHIQVLGGSQDDTLEVVSDLTSNVEGVVDGNRVELTATARSS